MSRTLKLSLIGAIAFIITLSLFFIVSGNQPNLQPQNSLTSCKTLKASGNGLSFLFFSDEKTARSYMNYLLEKEPYKTQKDNLDFYYIDDYDPKKDCQLYRGIALLCYSQNIIEKAGSCPYDYIIVPQKQSPTIRSSAYHGVASINTEVTKNVLIHEAGHLFDLAEEYDAKANPPAGSRNCASECSAFTLNNGCYKECSNSNLMRSINEGVMRTLSTSRYGDWNEYLITEEIKSKLQESRLTGNAISQSCKDQSYYLVHMKNSASGLQSVSSHLVIGCSPPQTSSDISYEYSNSKGESSQRHDAGSIDIFTDGNDNSFGTIDGETYKGEDVFFTIPYDPNYDSVSFYDSKGNKRGQSMLSPTNIPCEN